MFNYSAIVRSGGKITYDGKTLAFWEDENTIGEGVFVVTKEITSSLSLEEIYQAINKPLYNGNYFDEAMNILIGN